MAQEVSNNISYQQNIILTKEQQDIIYSNKDEDQRILACAGSGKTTTLIYRIKYLIQKGIRASQILLSTFNVEAANNLKIKAQQVLKQDAVDLNIMNIDKFTADIYNKHIKVNNNNNNNNNKIKLDVKEFGYQAKNYLSTQVGKENVLMKYEYFFFDEFQDVNQIQYDILILFKKAGCKIIVIGDEAQNIYSFRDTKLEFISSKINEDMRKISNKEINTYRLSTNFRCSSKITQFCNQIFANSKHFVKPMESLKEIDQVKSKPEISLYNNSDELVYGIISQIQKLIEDYQWTDLAILSPTRKQLIHFQEILEKHNSTLVESQKIPYSLRFRNVNNFFNCDNSDAAVEQKNLTLSTIHASKGLEWKVVFIIGINDSNFPGSFIKNLQEENDIQEKLNECRRLFYVACTRAKEQLLYRSVAEKFLKSSTIKNENAEKILCTINWYGKSKIVYNKCKEFFNEKKLDFQNLNSPQQFIDCLNDHYNKKQEFDENEIKILQKIDVCYATESRSFNYFPKDFIDKQEYVNSYLTFSDKTQMTENILKDVYNVSKCCLISQGIRRSLYRNDKDLLHSWELKWNIIRFLKNLSEKYDKNRFEIKKKVEYDTLNGVVDLIAFDKSLVYAYILKKEGYNIKNIAFYNLLKEDWITYSIEQWNQEEEFLRFLQKKKEDYQKEQEESQETDDNLEEENEQEVEIQENNLQNQNTSIEEEKEDEKEEEKDNKKS